MFEIGKPAKGEKFFDRSKAKRTLGQLMTDHVDIMIKAPRRYGKTSLIKEVLGDSPYVYVDFMKRPNLNLITEDILNQLFGIMGIKSFTEKAKHKLSELFAGYDIKSSIGLEDISLGIEIINSKEKDTCIDFLKTLKIVEKLGKKSNQIFTIVFDEFQEIVKYECEGDILKMLRGELQHNEHIHTVFLGSVESIMNNIFDDKNTPFYNYCRKMDLEPFDLNELEQELSKLFSNKKIVFENQDGLKNFLVKLGGHPANTMLAIQILYYIMLDKESVMLVKQEDLDEAYESAYYDRKDAIVQMILRAKTKKHYHNVLYCIANEVEMELDSQSLYKARKGLVDMGLLINRGRDNYLIADNFLIEYLKENELA